MYAIVEIAGQQFRVKKDQKIFVHRLSSEEGDKIKFDKVLLLDKNGKVTIGTPVIEGAAVAVEILRHLKGDKVIVFKKKRRKGYKKKNGHRQYLTEILVENIIASGFKAEKKKETKSKPATPGEKKKTATKKTVTKKVVAKKPVKKSAISTADTKTGTKKEKPVVRKTTTTKKQITKKPVAKKAADDLKKIEGIGPKIASILKEAGYETFAKLAKANPEKIRELLLEKGGKRYGMYNPETWPEQAKLAAAKKWDELKKMQSKLDGGRS